LGTVTVLSVGVCGVGLQNPGQRREVGEGRRQYGRSHMGDGYFYRFSRVSV
jgi:hypothetical protein